MFFTFTVVCRIKFVMNFMGLYNIKTLNNRGSNMRSHHEIALASIKCFTDDGTLDIEEVNFLLGLALRDSVIDEGEKRVLADIFSQVNKDTVSPKTWERMESVRVKYGF